MKLKIFLFLLLYFTPKLGVTQNCSQVTVNPNFTLPQFDFSDLNSCGNFAVKVKPIFILNQSGSTNTTIQDFMIGFQKASEIFAQYGIYLILESSDATTQFPDLYNLTTNGSNYISRYSDLTNYSVTLHPNTLNIFIGSKTSMNWYGATGVYPLNTGENLPSNMIYIAGTFPYNNLPCISGPTLIHELGHAFGLLHTFNTSTCAENVSRLPQYNNCATCGDKVCDTPADPNVSNHMNLVNANCDYIGSGSIVDPNFMPYMPDTKNYMSYYHGCVEHFTEGQGVRMRGILNAFINAMPYVNKNVPLQINSNLTISGTVKLQQSMHILAGSTVTITGRLEMSLGKYIFVAPGATLVVDGGVITRYLKNFTDICYGVEGMWGGIRLIGNINSPQTSVNQGKLVIFNEGIIEHAEVGVATVASINNQPYGGGIISASNAIFRNNGLAVSLGSYEFAPNISAFSNCTFEVNNDYFMGGSSPTGFVNIWRNKNVKFKGCDFINNAWEQPFAQNLFGIQSYDAGFSVDFNCSGSDIYPCSPSFQDSSSFQNLLYGIKAHKISSNHSYSVARTKFAQNYRSIFNSGVDQPALLQNTFYFNINPYPDPMVGIAIISGTGYRVEENTFLGKPSANGQTVGIWVDGTGAADNEIYKNTFYNIGYANLSTGINRRSDGQTGLRFRCNNMNGAAYDISVVKTVSSSGIANMQIGNTNPTASALPSAGNKFSLIGQTESDLYNNSIFTFNYFYNKYGIREEPQYISPNRVLKYEGFVNFCNSNISVGGPTEEHLLLDEIELAELEDEYNQHKAAYLTILYNYNSLIDGGSTSQLLQQVYETWPSEVWVLRQELLSKSPFLSIQTLLETAEAQILPRAILLEVILANPDISNNPALMDWLNSQNPPVPAYMIELIQNSWGQETPRSAIEASMAVQASAMNHILNRIIHHYAVDTVERSEYIIDWLEQAIDLPSKFQLAIYHAELGDSETALSTLSNLSTNGFATSEEEELQIEMLVSLIEAIDAVSYQNNNFNEIPGNILDNLETYLNSYTDHHGYGLTLIGNLLCQVRANCQNLIPALPSNMANLRTSGSTPSNSKIQEMIELNVYPNPASSYTSIEYNLYTDEKDLSLNVYTLQSIQVQKIAQTSKNDTTVLNTSTLSPGMYYIQLENSTGQVLGRKKLIVQ